MQHAATLTKDEKERNEVPAAANCNNNNNQSVLVVCLVLCHCLLLPTSNSLKSHLIINFIQKNVKKEKRKRNYV